MIIAILGIFITILGMFTTILLLIMLFNKINYDRELREAKLDRYRKATEEMMKPSLLKAFHGFNFKDLNEDEEDY